MAKFHNYYVLCPLIDQNSFLGLSQDKDVEYVIVTLGRNVVNKYRLSDQKQTGGWTSKDHITSAVVYDVEQDSYVGVFNNNTIKMWKEDSDNLDKVKKYKFPLNILKVMPRGERSSLIIFRNGNCASLTYALDNRKTYEGKPLIRDTEVIVNTAFHIANNTDHICYIIKDNKDNYEIITCPLREELGDLDKSKLSRVKIMRPEDAHVVGQQICVADSPAVYVLWSDSKMTSYDLTKKSWRTIGTVPWLSTLTSVSLAWMGKNHLILFGSNVEQDGAIIIAYNIVLGIGSCRYPMKMYSEDARLYCFSDRIILEASNHIGMLPYTLETKRNLSSLLGSHEVIQNEYTEIANWDSPTTPLFKVGDEIKELLRLGLPERSICSQIIPPLLETSDFRRVFRTVKEFKDVPESVLVLLLNYAVRLVDPNDVDITNRDEFASFCTEKGTKEEVSVHKAKFQLLNYVFRIPFSDALLIPRLKDGLGLNDALFVMTYICHLLYDSNCNMDSDYESKLFDWCILLMDSFYQQYLMTKDETVTYVLENTRLVVVKLLEQLAVVDSTMPLLNKLLFGSTDDNEESLSYSIELMQI